MFSTRYFLKLYRFGTMPYHAYDATYLYCQQLSTARGMLLYSRFHFFVFLVSAMDFIWEGTVTRGTRR